MSFASELRAMKAEAETSPLRQAARWRGYRPLRVMLTDSTDEILAVLDSIAAVRKAVHEVVVVHGEPSEEVPSVWLTSTEAAMDLESAEANLAVALDRLDAKVQ